jgi:hypothetical protein
MVTGYFHLLRRTMAKNKFDDEVKWLNLHKPLHPRKPAKTITNTVIVGSVTVGNYGRVPIPDFRAATELHVEMLSYSPDADDDNGSVVIDFVRYEEVPNPIYKTVYEHYLTAMRDYRVRLKEWKAVKAKLDEKISKAACKLSK